MDGFSQDEKQECVGWLQKRQIPKRSISLPHVLLHELRLPSQTPGDHGHLQDALLLVYWAESFLLPTHVKYQRLLDYKPVSKRNSQAFYRSRQLLFTHTIHKPDIPSQPYLNVFGFSNEPFYLIHFVYYQVSFIPTYFISPEFKFVLLFSFVNFDKFKHHKLL